MPAGTVHVRIAYWAEVVGEVEAVAKVTMHAPSDPAADVTPVASSTVVTHVPLPTVAALTGCNGTDHTAAIPERREKHTRTVRRRMAAG